MEKIKEIIKSAITNFLYLLDHAHKLKDFRKHEIDLIM